MSAATLSRATLLLDSPSCVYRAFYGVPNIEDKSGQAVNAARGYIDMVSTLIRGETPRRVIHTFDANWRPDWRVKAYPEYKAQRVAENEEEQEPDELQGQWDIIRDVLDAAGMERAEAYDCEADDVIATLANKATDKYRVAIVTGDRDLFQLVRDPAVIVLYTAKGLRNLDRVDEARVLEKYGIPASRYADFAILRGDPSDGLPGLRGVGEKGAAKLVNEYGSVDDLLASANHQPARLRDALLSQVDYLNAMKTVVPVAIDVDIDMTKPSEPNLERLRSLAELHNLASPVERLIEVLPTLQAASTAR